MDSFYVTLLSNASLDSYKENNPSGFTNKLESAVSLNGEWEVGLKQIQFTNEITFKTRGFYMAVWYCQGLESVRRSIREDAGASDEIFTELTSFDDIGSHVFYNYDVALIYIPPSSWANAYEFGSCIARLMQLNLRPRGLVFDVHFERNLSTQKSDFIGLRRETSRLGYLAITTKESAYMRYLGLVEAPKVDDDVQVKMYLFDRNFDKEPLSPSTSFGFPGPEVVFVYTDIVKNQIVAEKHGGLLQFVPIQDSKKSVRQFVSFDSPAYLPLKPRDHVSTISIRLTDVNGDNIEIEKDNFTSVQLHFRKREFQGWS